MRGPMPDTEAMRLLARRFLGTAREHDLEQLEAGFELNDRYVRVVISRGRLLEHDEDGESEQRTEHIEVRVGTRSRSEIVVAAPAAWLD